MSRHEQKAPASEPARPSRYGVDIDMANVNSAHSLAIGAVVPGSDVLDIGAADGSVARVLKKLGCRVWGIEADKIAAEEAALACEAVVVGDVEAMDLPEALGGKRFDVVLLLDVLEHLRDPAAVLSSIKGVLAPKGYAVASIPNVAHVAVRLQLLKGRFTYTDTGLLDRTHLRFFDRASVGELLLSAGFQAFDDIVVRSRVHETEIPVELSSLPAGLLDQIMADPDAETFQFVITIAPQGSAVFDDPPYLPIRELQRRLRPYELDYEGFVRSVREPVERELHWLRSQHDGLQRELNAAVLQLSSAREQLSWSQAEGAHAREELARLQATKLFRYTKRLRDGIYKLRTTGM